MAGDFVPEILDEDKINQASVEVYFLLKSIDYLAQDNDTHYAVFPYQENVKTVFHFVDERKWSKHSM